MHPPSTVVSCSTCVLNSASDLRGAAILISFLAHIIFRTLAVSGDECTKIQKVRWGSGLERRQKKS